MLNEELYDLDKMESEVDAEQYIGEEVLSAGHACILPLANSIGMEDSDMFTGEEFVQMDLTLMRSLKPEKAVLLLRKGWQGSDGANREFEEAVDLGWFLVLDMELSDHKDDLKLNLEEMLRDFGPMTFYIAGKYRHWKEDATDDE